MAFRVGQQRTLEDWVQEPHLDPNHWLVRLAERLPWERIAEALRSFYSPKGRLALQARLIVGLLILKHLYDLGDRVVVDGVHENLYWQRFCGVSLPRAVETDAELASGPSPIPRLLHPTVLTKFRRRVGPEGLERIQAIVREELRRMGLVKGRSVAVDTTAQPKNVRYPTDTHMLDHGRKVIVRLIRQVGELGVRIQSGFRTFVRVAKRCVLSAAKFGRDRLERVERANAQLSTMAAHVIRRAKEFLTRAQEWREGGVPGTDASSAANRGSG